MCKSASFVLTKTQCFWSHNGDSHSLIISVNGLHEDGPYGPNILRAEISPPNDRYDLPIDQWVYRVDQDIWPVWYDAEDCERRARAELPAWYAAHVISDGKVGKCLDEWTCIVLKGGKCNQSGGYCLVYDGGVNNQSGGDCRVDDGGINNQLRGYCYVNDGGTNNQLGGDCRVYDGGVNNQSGGDCRVDDGGVNNQSGGYCFVHDGGVNNQSGGECRVHGGGELNEVTR
jgi:hypothetical protein